MFLTHSQQFKACVAYNINGKITTELPYDLAKDVEPVYKEIKGWQTDLTQCTSEEQLPQAFLDYITFLEKRIRNTNFNYICWS